MLNFLRRYSAVKSDCLRGAVCCFSNVSESLNLVKLYVETPQYLYNSQMYITHICMPKRYSYHVLLWLWKLFVTGDVLEWWITVVAVTTV
jgi:hypothetical protein